MYSTGGMMEVRRLVSRRKQKYDWDRIREVINDVIEESYKKYGIEPSVRRILYRLRDLGLLPVTEQAYKALSKKLTKWREEGIIDWRKIRDAKKEREISYLEPWESYRENPISVQEVLDIVKRSIDTLFEVRINPWRDQKYRIIVFVEKEGEFHTIKKIVADVWEFGVYAIHSGAGYDSATWKFELAETVKAIVDQGYTPVVLSFGDFDPSGVDIDRDFVEKVKKYSGIKELIWERVAVTVDQIEKYHLTGIFRSDEEYEKFMRDPRSTKFIQKYGTRKVELSEFLESVPVDDVKRIVRRSIEKYFDWNVYRSITMKRYEEMKRRTEQAKMETIKKLEELLKTSLS